MEYRLSRHAIEEMERRGLSREVVAQVLSQPEQVVDERGGRRCYQSRIRFPDGQFLVRVVVVERTRPATVVTAYRTSRIEKYWSE